MKIGDTAYIRYKEIYIIQYYPEYNAFRAAQTNPTGGYNKLTEFIIPAGIFNVQPNIRYEDFQKKQMEKHPNKDIWADKWLNGKPYHIHYNVDDYEETGLYYLYPLIEDKCLKKHSINEAVDFNSIPLKKQAEKFYLKEQEGYAFQGETFSGTVIKGQVLWLFSKPRNMPPIMHEELDADILKNRFAQVWAVLDVSNHLTMFKVESLKFESK